MAINKLKIYGIILIIILIFFGFSHQFLLLQVFPQTDSMVPQEVFSSHEYVYPRGFLKGQKWSVNDCIFVFVQDSVVEKGEGTGIFYRIYPRRGEDFFFTIRALSDRISKEKVKLALEGKGFTEEEAIVGMNPLVIRMTYIEEGHLLLYQAIRKELPELMDFFLSCDKDTK